MNCKRPDIGPKAGTGEIRKADISFQTYDLFNQFVDGVSEYAYLAGATDDPVTEGDIPTSVTSEQLLHAKMVSAVMVQLRWHMRLELLMPDSLSIKR